MNPEEIIDSYFRAMRQGPSGQADLLALFADEAVYHEPFVAPETPAIGRQAIGDRLRTAWEDPPPDMQLDVLQVDVDGSRAEVHWECRSPAFPAPVKGVDRYRFEAGRISELRVSIDRSDA